ncbi:peptidoglycan editing factor PgeF [Candidatus Solincola sp.]|nr:peptidoglycan editing factor PgeF [Actinomycetota bacterium]MDI7252285.1 peptidoglycan editing factor PgeF [Actinomycetota bacterium]
MRKAEGKGIKEGNADWLEAGRLLGEGMALYFTRRWGGVSPPPFASLNLSVNNGDDPRNVLENRSRVAERLGVELRDVVFMRQVHGTRVRRVLGGGRRRERVVPAADGLFTTRPGLVLAALTADCVPLALGFPSPRGVAMLHAGWRGTLNDIAGEALRRLRSLGVRPEEVRAVMGPAIGPCCYRVDKGRALLFVEKYGEESGVVTGDGERRLDLFRANRINLLRAGLREENILRVGGCTCCDEDFFSFRREGVTGRQGAFVFLLP